MARELSVLAAIDGARSRRGRARLEPEALVVEAGGRTVTLRYSALTRILFDGRRLQLATAEHQVALQRLRAWLPLPSPRRTEALARALQPVAGRAEARLEVDALAC